jgi:hypothetical protein
LPWLPPTVYKDTWSIGAMFNFPFLTPHSLTLLYSSSAAWSLPRPLFTFSSLVHNPPILSLAF